MPTFWLFTFDYSFWLFWLFILSISFLPFGLQMAVQTNTIIMVVFPYPLHVITVFDSHCAFWKHIATQNSVYNLLFLFGSRFKCIISSRMFDRNFKITYYQSPITPWKFILYNVSFQQFFSNIEPGVIPEHFFHSLNQHTFLETACY